MKNHSIHASANVAPDAIVGDYSVVHENCEIGCGCIIGSGVILHANTKLGIGITVFDHAVLGRPPKRVGGMTRAVAHDLPPLSIGDGCVVGAGAVIYQGTTIGQNCLLGDLCSIREQCVIGDDCIIARLVTINYETHIGNKVKVMDNTHLTGNMVIEDGVFISVLVSTTNDNSMDREKNPSSHFGGPIIRRGASIGASAVLLPGVTIEEFAVVASGAVVNRDVPARKIAAGNPARALKDVPTEWIPTEYR